MAMCVAAPVDPTQRVKCSACGTRFAWINLVTNTGLAALKASIGVLTGSEALVVSSLYSINDVLSAAAVLTSLRMAKRAPNDEHPFGYGKVEFLAVGAVSVVLAASVCFFVYEAFSLFSGEQGSPSGLAATVALLSLTVSEVLARRGFCVARKLDSPALHTSAEHNRADAISSGAVLVGICGAALGIPVLDRLIAVYEAVDIMRLAGALLGQSLKGLMDHALPASRVEILRRACLKVPGVMHVKAIRSRRAGSHVWVDVVVAVNEDQSVQQAHEVTNQVHLIVADVLGPRTRAQIAFRAHQPRNQAVETAGAHA
ncbi:MAG: cation transporter [Deltaproteobacteria bacterium]|nr:cation transporter [Deltaproteobacteria bacterium]